MKTNNNSKTNLILIIIGLLVIVSSALVLSGAVNLKDLKLGSVVNAVSTINYASNSGQVRDGYLYGSKIVIFMTVTQDPADITYSIAKTEQSWGNYKIIPQNNMRIKISTTPKAESQLNQYQKPYFKNFWGTVSQTQDLVGTSWNKYTPLRIEVYSDTTSTPTAPILVKDLPDSAIAGQQLYQIDNTGINVQRSAIVSTGTQQLPSPDSIVVATSPKFAEFKTAVSTDYPLEPKTYIFDKSSYDSRIDYFYANAQNGFFGSFKNPNLALWTGYDKWDYAGSICGLLFDANYKNGYCKVNGWNGLYSAITQPTFALQYDAIGGKLVANNIQYGAQMNLEIPSETVKSLAVLRGVGQPEFTMTVTNAIKQGERSYLKVFVNNKGDTDGFSVVPKSKSGKLIFTPSSYTSQSIPYNTQREFTFVMAVAGTETGVDVNEELTVTVQAEHNPTPSTKTTTIGISYDALAEPGTTQTNADTMVIENKTGTDDAEKITWYDTTPAKVLAGLIVILVALLYWRKQNE